MSLGEAQLMLDEANGHWTAGELKYPFGNGVNFQIEIKGIGDFVQNIKEQGVVLFRDIFKSTYRCGKECYVEKEVLVQDPDGYLLRFSETLKRDGLG